MLQVTPDNYTAIQKYVARRWPEKRVSCQDNPDAQHKNRFIKISTLVDEHIAHYEYSNGWLELHLEGDYYGNYFNYWFYKYLRETADTNNGNYRWHKWWNMKQGRLTYSQFICNQLDLADALSQMVPYIDGLVNIFLNKNEESSPQNTEELGMIQSNFDDTAILRNYCEQLPAPNNMAVSKLESYVRDIKNIPFEDLVIPDYQRPYKWNSKQVNQLINDLLVFQSKKEYLLGTLVLHENNIVDGQQRIVTLSLVFYVLFENLIINTTKEVPYNDFLLKIKIFWQRTIFKDPISIAHVRENLSCIRERKEDLDYEMLAFLLNKCQFVVVNLPKISEAFQFFDSQNARGKDLEPHDLLKAFHLREIPELNMRDKQNVTYWQDENPLFLVQLFLSMFRVNRWPKSYSGDVFTKDDIDVFKGISISSKRYPFYLQQIICHYFISDYVVDKTRMIDRINLEYPFQLDQICINGSRFFDMVRYYGSLFKQIVKSDTYESYGTYERSAYKVIDFLNTYCYRNRTRKGDVYMRELFNCTILYYIDRFGFEEINKVVCKLFKAVYCLRIEQYSVKLATINNFAMNERLFKIIRDAHTPFDIINILPRQPKKKADNIDENNDELYLFYQNL